ncbi:hypothetical protein FDECE_997 [Fusarium decemcellulare]|nr:hypothetical protein FDECE_997 [Fusarium decemcellulare]
MSDPDTVMMDGNSNPTASIDPATSGSAIQKIPLEVLLRITYFLNTQELGRVRLLCRSIEQALYTSFTNEFFTRKQFMISQTSLQALIDISKSRLGPHLRKVHIGLDRFAQPQVHGDDARTARLAELFAEQFTMLGSGYHRDMLTEAFRHLENLEDVIIRDFNSSRRTRDGPNRQWTSYSSTTAYQETGIRPSIGHATAWSITPAAGGAFGSTVFNSVLFALGQAEARPKGIEYMSRHRNPLRDYAFNLPSYMSSVGPVLESLEKLHIDVGLIHGDVLPFSAGSVPTHSPSSDVLLRQFLLKTTNLKHLRINETHDSVAGPGVLLSWLAQTTTTTSPPSGPSPTFPHLEELNLGMMNIEATHILQVVRKFAPTLKRLELWKVNLLRRLPNDLTGAPPKVSFWTKFLERLKDIPLDSLRHIKVGNPQQQWISRPTKSWVNFEGNNVTEYTGTDWRHFVGEVIPKVVVHYTHDEGSDGEGDDDDDEDDGIWDQYALDL